MYIFIKNLKFAKKSLENVNFSRLFPLREIKHEMKVIMSDKYYFNPSIKDKNLRNW